MLEDWFKECVDNKRINLYKDKESEFFIYKGFKLDNTNDGIILLDVRFNDFYDPVGKRDFNKLKKLGFVKGCDLIMHQRDIKRVKRYKITLESLYTERKVLEDKAQYPRSRALAVKKLRKLKSDLQDNIDLLFFYDARREQMKIKYKLK